MENLLKIIKSSKLKHICIILFLLLLFVFISAYSYANTVLTDISDSVFRLHVIANSDNGEDQELKYIVRDKVLEYINEISSDIYHKEEIINLVNDNIENIKNIAQNTVLENGFDYTVDLKIGNFIFPTKQYGDMSLPSGYYDALRIEIGNAEGKNWWCVMFPPLCFVDVSSGVVPEDSKTKLKENLSDEEYDIISTNSSNDIQFKFKILEMFNNIKTITAKK